MLVSTTPEVQGKKIAKYLGIVSGESIMGADFIKDFMASIKDVIGGRAELYEEELRKAKKTALNEMMKEAKKLGANAIVGVSLDYETISSGSKSMLMVCVSGTAVVLESSEY